MAMIPLSKAVDAAPVRPEGIVKDSYNHIVAITFRSKAGSTNLVALPVVDDGVISISSAFSIKNIYLDWDDFKAAPVDEIVKYCKEYGIRMCFDVSHTMLTCNHYKQDFYDFASKIAPFTAHIHMGDAKGVNGEGLQIGEGEIDFVKLGKILNDSCPNASFIPEIWQGHKNNGEGFWIALQKLENVL
jgi:hypothetical protein